MVNTSNMIKQTLHKYVNKNSKLAREAKKGNIIKIVNGLYETDPNTPGYLLAGSIYGPSYISFEYALSYYGLIPERVTTITSATLLKKKQKKYYTPFGTFTYRDVPALVFPEAVLLKEENNYAYQIASPEKAICDKLYTLKPIHNYQELENILFKDLRIDYDEFIKLDEIIITKLSDLYHCENVKLLTKYLRRNKYE